MNYREGTCAECGEDADDILPTGRCETCEDWIVITRKPEILTALSREYLEGARDKIGAILDGTLRDGTGGTAPSRSQILSHIRGARELLGAVAEWVETEGS